jgi:MerR HTH family regulatory protein
MDPTLQDEINWRLFPEAMERRRRNAERQIPGRLRPEPPPSPAPDDGVPGRTAPDRRPVPSRDDDRPVWAGRPRTFSKRPGEEFFEIRILAKQLRRKSNTMRAWHSSGFLPKARFHAYGRRLYTRAQIEGLVRIAEEEGLLRDKRRNPATTHFPQRAKELFDRIAAEARRTE